MSRDLITLLAVAVLLAGGCQTVPTQGGGNYQPRLGGPVTSPATLPMEGWEFARNDWYVNPRPALAADGLQILEIHTHDRLGTSNGRPREHSRTDIHAVQVRIRR